MYKLLRDILFLFDAEDVHYFSMNFLKLICKISFIKKMISDRYRVINNPFDAFGLTFKNHVGLGAGFDKNAKYLSELECLGFGFVEIGTVTPLPQRGNPKPRLFRLKKDGALVNRMGFNNEGAVSIASRLKEWKGSHSSTMMIGGNIGKNKNTSNEDAWKDFEFCYRRLYDVVDYFVVNVSSPNTPGLRELQEKESLRKIIGNLQSINNKQVRPKPLLVKIAPDLTFSQIDDLIDLATELNLSGIVASNTTILREDLVTNSFIVESMGTGGLSGKPLRKRSTEIITYLHKKTNGVLPIIGSGGIFNANDALEKLNAGALLVQVWSGFIYEGPEIVKNICATLYSNTTPI